MQRFMINSVEVDVLEGAHEISLVPPSEWRGDKQARTARARLANFKAEDGLRAQVSLVRWADAEEVSLGFAEILAGPADYERLVSAGAISPKLVNGKLVARIRALRYGLSGRANGVAIEWSQIDDWAGGDARTVLKSLGATRTGAYGDLLPTATRFRTEPAIEVPYDSPAALFAVYALTRIIPIMNGYGREAPESPNL